MPFSETGLAGSLCSFFVLSQTIQRNPVPFIGNTLGTPTRAASAMPYHSGQRAVTGFRLRRDSYLDNLRGGFHIVMLVDHLPIILPGMFTLIAGLYEALGYVSAAEGFVFLSGYVTGLVYTRVKE